VLERLLESYPDDVRIVYRNFPIGHETSDIAVQASEAANLQGKFWEMHDVLFDSATWNTWMEMDVAAFQTWIIDQAGKIGLDVEQFTADLTSDAVVQRTTDAQAAATQAGVNATPSLYILLDGKLLWDPNDGLTPSFENLEAILKLWQNQGSQFSECPAVTVDAAKKYSAVITTTKGDITVELYPDKAPLTVNSFVFLAGQGWYNDVPFHRVVEGFVAQAGDPSGTGIGGPGYEYGDEITDLKFDDAGVMGMANAGAGTNGSQFFITLAAQPDLDNNYTVFGKVTSGMDVVQSLTLRDPSTMPELPEPDKILSITVTVQ
jgi:cyclophilin family peptidyl-prolyl cis-trans isomerase